MCRTHASVRVIARQLHTSYSNVRYWLRKHGLHTDDIARAHREHRDRRCLLCKTVICRGPGYGRVQYCSFECQKEYQYRQYIRLWKSGKVTGRNAGRHTGLSRYVKRYVWEKYGGKCAKCTWGQKNPVTSKSPLDIDHIDGNYKNCRERNLILLCPNCHSLTPTYKGLNRGHGRSSRHAPKALR